MKNFIKQQPIPDAHLIQQELKQFLEVVLIDVVPNAVINHLKVDIDRYDATLDFDIKLSINFDPKKPISYRFMESFPFTDFKTEEVLQKELQELFDELCINLLVGMLKTVTMSIKEFVPKKIDYNRVLELVKE